LFGVPAVYILFMIFTPLFISKIVILDSANLQNPL
jgi:hypothetical protein